MLYSYTASPQPIPPHRIDIEQFIPQQTIAEQPANQYAPLTVPPRVLRRLQLARARRALRRTRAAYRQSRTNLGNSNKMGTHLSRSECMSALNRTRHALRRTIRDTEVLLGRREK
jgi:hypothetical protein